MIRRRTFLPLVAGSLAGCQSLEAINVSKVTSYFKPAEKRRYVNPVLTGFHADPSICHVKSSGGDDYYLVTSSFEYFPGVPIHHSRDLVNWRLIGYALTRESQLPLEGQASNKGIFAPTLRHHAGVFYMVTTNIENGGSFFVTATNPAGPWSEPFWLKESSWGMDPSLFFDDDGKVYYTRHGGGRNGGVYQAEIDLKAGKLKADVKLIWSGTGGVWPEGPHLYKHDGWYFLMISEGGTSWDHSLTLARSRSPWGPFEAHPDNPILTHRNLSLEPLQMVGHGDLVQAANGSWWMVMLGTRPKARATPLGRETLLAPCSWDENGWLMINNRQPITPQMEVSDLPPARPWPAVPVRDDFNGPTLGLEWNFLRSSAQGLWTMSERLGWLRLIGSTATLADKTTPAFIGRRQTALRQRAATEMDFAPLAPDQHAGMVLRRDDSTFCVFRLAGGKNGARKLELVSRVEGVDTVVRSMPLPQTTFGTVRLQIDAYPDRYVFSYSMEGTPSEEFGSVSSASLSVGSSFTGVFIGLYASGSQPMPPADFDWFDLETIGA